MNNLKQILSYFFLIPWFLVDKTSFGQEIFDWKVMHTWKKCIFFRMNNDKNQMRSVSFVNHVFCFGVLSHWGFSPFCVFCFFLLSLRYLFLSEFHDLLRHFCWQVSKCFFSFFVVLVICVFKVDRYKWRYVASIGLWRCMFFLVSWSDKCWYCF